MDVLYIASTGSADPTRASIPFHLAANGSVEIGQSVALVVAGDAAELLKASVRESLEGVGVPPFRELHAKVRQHEVPIHV